MMNLNSTNKTLPSLLRAAIACVTLCACSSAEPGMPETVGQEGQDLFLEGAKWPNSTVYVCYDSVDGNNQALRDEAKRVLAATWSRGTKLTFPGGSALTGALADWGPCDYNTTLTGNYQSIALHFCTASTNTSHCRDEIYDGAMCVTGVCTQNAQCGTGGTCTAGKCTAGACSDDSQCGTGTGANLGNCKGVRRADHFRGVSAVGAVPFTTVGQFFTPGMTHVSLIGDNADTYLARFRYQVVHEFGHAIGMGHEQARPENVGSIFCNNGVPATPDTGNALGTIYDGNSIMNYCASDALTRGLLTNLSGVDINGGRQAYQTLPSSHGFRILSDGDATLAVNAFGGARVNGPLKLFKNCPITNPDCTWRYQRGMLLSDKDPTLAIKLIQDPATSKYYLALVTAALTDTPAGTYTCTPDKPECTWSWKLGQFESDAPTAQKYRMNARGGSTNLADVGVSPVCDTSNSACTWTMPDVMLTNERDVTLPINANGGAFDHAFLVLHNACDTNNNSCTFTFSHGRIIPTGNANVAWNAWGGAHEGGDTIINFNCNLAQGGATNASCNWTWSHGRLISDDLTNGTLVVKAVSGTNGALHLAKLLMTKTCDAKNPDCVFSGFWAKN